MQALIRFRRNMQTAMDTRGVSQRELAALAGVSYPYINRILQGKVEPTIPKADAIAEALGHSLLQLLLPQSQFNRLASNAVSH